GIRDGHVTGVQTCALPIYVTGAVEILMRHAAAHGATTAKGRPLVDEQLLEHEVVAVEVEVVLGVGGGRLDRLGHVAGGVLGRERSEERRVGKEWRCGWVGE